MSDMSALELLSLVVRHVSNHYLIIPRYSAGLFQYAHKVNLNLYFKNETGNYTLIDLYYISEVTFFKKGDVYVEL